MILYNRIGMNYDLTRRADPYIVSRLIHHLKVNPNKKYLDVACGSGNYTIAIADTGALMYGIDHSSIMIETAKRKSKSITWLVGDVRSLPFEDEFFDGALCTLAIHHFNNLEFVFTEVFRVMRSGRFVLFTSSPEQMRGYWLNEYFPQALDKSIKQMPQVNNVFNSLRAVGFTDVDTEIYEVSNDLQDLFLYSGKYQPEMYLDPHIRAGSSTFSSLADPNEVIKGCNKLENDIQSGQIGDVMNSYQHDQGDYLFIVAEKKASNNRKGD